MTLTAKMPIPVSLAICLLTLCLVLSGCASKPKPSSSHSPQTIQTLKQQKMPNRLAIPVHGISKNQLRDTWGAARSSGRRHEGIDIMAPTGTKVYAATDGVIMSLKGNNLGGTVIWKMGPGGVWHYYAHLDRHRSGLREGDFVRQGQHIG